MDDYCQKKPNPSSIPSRWPHQVWFSFANFPWFSHGFQDLSHPLAAQQHRCPLHRGPRALHRPSHRGHQRHRRLRRLRSQRRRGGAGARGLGHGGGGGLGGDDAGDPSAGAWKGGENRGGKMWEKWWKIWEKWWKNGGQIYGKRSKEMWKDHLVGGDWNHGILNDFPYGNFIMPTDELIFFRGVAQPPTSNYVEQDGNRWNSWVGFILWLWKNKGFEDKFISHVHTCSACS